MNQLLLNGSNGFLDLNYKNNIEQIKLVYKDWFNLIDEINQFIYSLYEQIDVKNNDIIGMYLLTAFSKVHKSFQSVSILYSYGLEEDVHVLFRTMLESLFISPSIKKNHENYNILLENQKIEDQISKNHLIDLGLINETKEKITKRKKGIKHFAKEGGLYEMYSAYIHLCSYTHIDLRNFENSFDKKDGEIVGICIAPTTNDLKFILTELIALMLNYI